MIIWLRCASPLIKEAQRHSPVFNLPACCLGRFQSGQSPKFSFGPNLKTVLAK